VAASGQAGSAPRAGTSTAGPFAAVVPARMPRSRPSPSAPVRRRHRSPRRYPTKAPHGRVSSPSSAAPLAVSARDPCRRRRRLDRAAGPRLSSLLYGEGPHLARGRPTPWSRVLGGRADDVGGAVWGARRSAHPAGAAEAEAGPAAIQGGRGAAVSGWPRSFFPDDHRGRRACTAAYLPRSREAVWRGCDCQQRWRHFRTRAPMKLASLPSKPSKGRLWEVSGRRQRALQGAPAIQLLAVDAGAAVAPLPHAGGDARLQRV